MCKKKGAQSKTSLIRSFKHRCPLSSLVFAVGYFNIAHPTVEYIIIIHHTFYTLHP